MDCDHKRHLTFPLRLPSSMRDAANVIAHQDGISLNHFISLAVAEKISRLVLRDRRLDVVDARRALALCLLFEAIAVDQAKRPLAWLDALASSHCKW